MSEGVVLQGPAAEIQIPPKDRFRITVTYLDGNREEWESPESINIRTQHLGGPAGVPAVCFTVIERRLETKGKVRTRTIPITSVRCWDVEELEAGTLERVKQEVEAQRHRQQAQAQIQRGMIPQNWRGS